MVLRVKQVAVSKGREKTSFFVLMFSHPFISIFDKLLCQVVRGELSLFTVLEVRRRYLVSFYLTNRRVFSILGLFGETFSFLCGKH